MKSIVSLLIGFLFGAISGAGLGGGTFLVIYLTLAAGVSQTASQGINLLFFLPTAASSLVIHAKNKLVDWTAVLCAALPGAALAVVGGLLAGMIETNMLRRLFGGLLLISGGWELLRAIKK